MAFELSKKNTRSQLSVLIHTVGCAMDARQLEYRAKLVCEYYKPCHCDTDGQGIPCFMCSSGHELIPSMPVDQQKATIYNPIPGRCEDCQLSQLRRRTEFPWDLYFDGENSNEESPSDESRLSIVELANREEDRKNNGEK